MNRISKMNIMQSATYYLLLSHEYVRSESLIPDFFEQPERIGKGFKQNKRKQLTRSRKKRNKQF